MMNRDRLASIAFKTRYIPSEFVKQRGFTIVELLIVIVVIGILAAISIVSYTGIQNRANDTAIKNDLTNLAKVIRVASADTGDLPSGGGVKSTSTATVTGNGTNFAGVTFSPSKGSYKAETNLTYCTAPDASGAQQFTLRAKSTSGKIFEYSSATSSTSEYSTNPSTTIPLQYLACDNTWGYPRTWSYGWYSGVWTSWINN